MLGRLIRDNVEITFNLAPDLQEIIADSTNIDQVIINLALNGRDAMPDGGLLAIKTWNQKVDSLDELPDDGYIGSRSIGNYVCLSVTDTGKGFNEQIKSHLFEPFFTTKDNYNCTGLGLPVVYGIVKSHDGWINVKSQPDKGSVFEILFPAIDQTS
jgi:two-component system cell cycle sensor histidine kinase/response regulator CckA